MFAGTTRHVSSGATPAKRSNGNKTSLCSHDKPACEPGARCSVSILILVLEKKGNRLNTQGLQSSCGTHPSKQENYMVRLPGCPDFTSLGLGFQGCDPLAPDQQLTQPFAGAAAFPDHYTASAYCAGCRRKI